MKRIIVLLLLASIAAADLQVSTAVVSPSEMRPGVTGTASFTLSNTGNYPVTGIVIVPTGSGMFFSNARIDIGGLGSGGSTQVSVPFKINDDMGVGVYSLMVGVYWSADLDTGQEASYKLFSIPVTVANPAVFQVSSVEKETKVGRGSDFILHVNLQNTGGKARDVGLTVDSEDFLLSGTSRLSLGDIEKNANLSFEIPFTAKTAASIGMKNVPLVFDYEDSLGIARQYSASIGPVEVSSKVVEFEVQVDAEETAAPGEKIVLHLNLTNQGNEAAYSAKVSVDSASAYFVPIGTIDKKVGDIAASSRKSFDYEVGISPSIPPGYYALTVSTSYLNKQGEEQAPIQQQIGIEVLGKSNLDVIASTDPPVIYKPGAYSLALQISNIGSASLYSMSGEVESQSDRLGVLGSNKKYIGKIDANDDKNARFSIYVKSGTLPGKYPFKLKLSYLDNYHTLQSFEKTVYVEVVSQEIASLMGGNGGGLSLLETLVIISVLAAIAYFAYKRFFKHKNKG